MSISDALQIGFNTMQPHQPRDQHSSEQQATNMRGVSQGTLLGLLCQAKFASSRLLGAGFLALLLVFMGYFPLGNTCAQAQPCQSWDATFDRAGDDYAVAVEQTDDGGYVVLGTTCEGLCGISSDIWLIKTTASGDVEWQRTFNKGGAEVGRALLYVPGSGFVILGTTSSRETNFGDQTWIIGTDSEGSLQWEKTYPSGAGNDIQQTSDGGYVVVGESYIRELGRQVWLVKMDRMGNVEWDKSYGSSVPEEGMSVQETSDAGYIIVGYTGAVPGLWEGRGKGDPDLWLVKVDRHGNIEWDKTFGGSLGDEGQCVRQTSDGGYILAGTTESEDLLTAIDGIWLIKTDAHGDMQWDRVLVNGLSNWGECVRETTDGGFVVVGTTRHSDTFSNRGTDFWLIKTDRSGDVEWEETLGVGRSDHRYNDEIGYCVRQTRDGGYIVVGEKNAYEPEESAIWLVKCCPEGSTGAIKWRFEADRGIETSPAIGIDGTIIFWSYGVLHAVNPDGTEKWRIDTGTYVMDSGSPAIGRDGTIFVGLSDGKLHAINPDSTEKWHFTTGTFISTGPAIGNDGTIYIGSNNNKLYALNPSGEEKWRVMTEGQIMYSSPVIGADGTVCVGYGGHLYAFGPDGTPKWRFPISANALSAAIGNDGTIYVGGWRDESLHAIDPDGNQKWHFSTGSYVRSSPAIGSDGTIYCGSRDKHLYALNPDGSEKWRFETEGKIDSSPAIGTDGTIYLASDCLYAIGPDGNTRWHVPVGSGHAPAISEDGTIYVCSGQYLYAIASPSSGLADTPWPMFRHDPQLTGNASTQESRRYPRLVTAYTVKLNASQYQRVFQYGDDFHLIVVVRNNTSQDMSLDVDNIDVEIADEEGKERGSAAYDGVIGSVTIPPESFLTLMYRIHCSKEDVTWTSSGFTFAGKKLTATVTLGEQSKEYSFFIDEFGIPEWLRNVIFVEPPLSSDDIYQNIDPDKLTRRRLKNYYTDIAQRCNEIGFNCLAFGDYYKYGYLESHDPVLGIDHWFPASSSPLTYYNTPADYLVDITGSEQRARGLIEELVDILHDHGLKTRAYTDPNGLYSPDPAFWNPANPAYDGTVAHHDSEQLGWARFRNGEVQRLNYLESIVELPFGGSFPSPIRSLAVEICPSGPSKMGPANFDAGFDPAVIVEDLDSDPKNDPSFHYQEVKQTLWLTQEYGFDGICPDDTGRLIMAAGPASYKDDPWTRLLHPESPSSSLYGVCECEFCTQLQEAAMADDDLFALDSYANMIKHMRWQTKDNNPEGFLMSGDYLVPSDVGWTSIVASEDVSVSDQFNIWMPSFARWAYRTFNLGYRVLRTDLRRSLMLQPVPSFGRRDLLIGVLIATAWANKVHVDVNDPRDVKLFSRDEEEWDDADKLVYNYVRMRASLDHQYNTGQIAVPLFAEEEAQELLYHKKLADPVVNIQGEYDFVNAVPHGFPPCIISEEEPYTILYSLPGEHGERGRILHVMNNKVVSDCPNSSIECDYTFNIRIPEGEEIERILLVSADLYNGKIDPDRDGRSTTQEEKDYISGITSRVGDTSEGGALWRRVGDHIRIKVPHVIAYSAVLIEFSEATHAEEASTDDEALAREYMPNFWQLACDIEKGNSVSEVCYYVERDGGKAKIECSVVFEDEDHPNPVLDELYDLMRGSPVDIETFYVTVDLRSQEVERILFHFPYRPSCPSDPASMLDSFGQEGSGTWYGGQPYNVFLPVHYCEEFSGGQVAEEFDINDGHVDIYVATWNHLFSNSGAREPPYNCNEWRSFTYDTIELVNKSRGELEEERSLIGQPFAILATCPVNLTITDPDGLIVKKGSIQVSGATYVEEDVDFDGAPDDVVLIPDRKPGNYQIGVIPEYDALGTDRYTLRVSAAGSTKILADNVSIRDIPKTPYVVRSSAQGLSHPVEQAIPTISRKGGLGVGAVIGIVVGTLGLLTAGFLVFRFLRSRYYI